MTRLTAMTAAVALVACTAMTLCGPRPRALAQADTPNAAKEPVDPLNVEPGVAREVAGPVRFAAYDVLIDGDAPLAAYQVEVWSRTGNVAIVGIEGGADAAFADPPYYDPQAMRHDRVILAAFSTKPAAQLPPAGSTRVATIHVQITGDADPRFDTKLTAAATTDGAPLRATVNLKGATPR